MQQRAVWGEWHQSEPWRWHQRRGGELLLLHEGHQGIARGGHGDDAGGQSQDEALLVLSCGCSCGCGVCSGAAAAEAVVGVVAVLREAAWRCSGEA